MEHISAMMDSELDDKQVGHQLTRLRQEAQLQECWNTFHLIGDLMRGDRILSDRFEQCVCDKLAHEPTVLSPRRPAAKRIRTYALSAAASMSAVALVGWLAFFNNPLVPQQVAKAPANAPSAVVESSQQLSSVPSDGTMNEYLIAHQEYSPSTAIQGLAPYIRTVSSAQSTPRR